MSRKKYTTEKIITMLREAELLSNQGKFIKEISRKLGITEQTLPVEKRVYIIIIRRHNKFLSL